MTKSRIEKIQSNRHHRSRPPETRHLTHKTIPVTSILPERSRKLMQAQQSITPLKDVWKVSAWKWGIDKGAPRWRYLFFHWVFLPFLDFSFKLGIPTPKEREVESDEHGNTRVTYRWFEDEGIFPDPDQAEAGCLEEHWGYTCLPFGRLMPPESAQYGRTTFPRKKKGSRKWGALKFPFLIKDRKAEEQREKTLADYLARLNQVLDQ